MTQAPTAAEVAGKLTKAQRRALTLQPTWGFPAGHNQWPDVEYVEPDDPDITACSGEDMDAVMPRGLVTGGQRDEAGGIHLVDDDRECEARWPLDLTPLGLAVRAILMEQDRHD